MKILLFGAKGMLGWALRETFKENEIISLDREEVNIADEEEAHDAVRINDPDLIINAAAYTNVDKAEEEKELAMAVNGRGVANIARAAKEYDVRLVHYSTDYVFSGKKAEGYREDDEPDEPVNMYGKSKLAGEVALKESGANYFLLRTAWLYGPLLKDSHAAKKHFVETMLNLSEKKRDLKVVADQVGCPTMTLDLARATKEIVQGGFAPGIYHVVNEGQASWCEFAEEIFKIVKLSVKVEPISSEEYPLPAKRPRYSILLNTHGPKMRSWQVALNDYLTNYYGRI